MRSFITHLSGLLLQKMSVVQPRYAVSDWHTANTTLRTNAERLRESSHTIRQEARRLNNETDNHTR